MRSRRNSPIWPYLVVLAVLFALSVVAPRSWRGTSESSRDVGIVRDARLTQPARIVAPFDDEDISPALSIITLSAEQIRGAFVEIAPAAPDASNDNEAAQSLRLIDPRREELAFDDAPRELSPDSNESKPIDGLSSEDEPAPQVTVTDLEPPTIWVSDEDRLALRTKPFADSSESDGAKNRSLVDPKHELLAPRMSDWPRPESLLKRLDTLSEHSATAAWAIETSSAIRRLTGSPPVAPAAAAEILERLVRQVSAADALADQIESDELKTDFLRARFGLERRLDLWQPTQAILVAAPRPTTEQSVRDSRLARTLAEIAAITGSSPYGAAWDRYLQLDPLREIVGRRGASTATERRELALRVLGRLNDRALTNEQRTFLASHRINQFREEVSRWAARPVDARTVLVHAERYESTGSIDDAIQLADDHRSLALSDDVEERKLAEKIDRHYRNANLRVAVAAGLIERVLPPQDDIRQEVDDTIGGAEVWGESLTKTRLGVRLIPDSAGWRAELLAIGRVESETESTSGPVRFYSNGRTRYVASKSIHLTRSGLSISPARVEVDANTDLVGIDTNFDAIPLVNVMVRNYARSRHDASHGENLSEIEGKVAARAGSQMNREADAKLSASAVRLRRQLIAPLEGLGLDPTPLDMQTTDQRLVARLRLAGQNQLGSHTPRPRAPSDSLLSIQFHQSAINNTIDGLDLAGKSFSPRELYEYISSRLEREPSIPDDLPERATVTFESGRPVSVEFEEDRIKLTLAISELSEPGRSYRNFKVYTHYIIENDGLRAQLARDDIIYLEGDRLNLGAQIVLRGVFSKILSKNSRLDIIPATIVENPRMSDLEVSQSAIADGWIGIAIGPIRNRNEIARRK